MSETSNVGLYINHFRQLAVSHKDLQHDPDSETGDASPGSQRFTKISVDEVLKGLRSKVGFPCLCLELYDLDTESQIIYEVRKKLRGAFMVIDHPADKSFKAEENCYIVTDKIMDGLLRQIWQQHYGELVNRCNTPFKEFSFDKLSIVPVGPIFDNEFGYRVEFEFDFQDTTNLTTAPDQGTFI